MCLQLSIITPVYNSVVFIEKCLNNVLEQNGGDEVEHIIVDGGSKDGTMEKVREFAAKYNHIRFISEPDQGQSDAMNKGIQLAKGRCIGFLNADDFYAPFTLKRVLDIIRRESVSKIWVGNCKLIDAEGSLIYINRPERLKSYHIYAGLPFPINPVAYFYDASIHKHPDVGYYNVDNHYNMDYEFFLRASLHFPLIYFNEDWGYMVEHPTAKTAMDKENNDMENRKKALFNQYWNKAPLGVRIKAMLYRNFKKVIK